MKTFRPTRKRINVSVGESVRIIRELQGYSQNELARLTGIPQATLSAIENDRVRLGVERAKALARALKCHPAVLVFPGWDVGRDSAVSIGASANKSQSRITKPTATAGIAKPANCHTVRHSFSTHLLEARHDIRTVPVCVRRTGRQELLGHRDVSTTMIYTHVLNQGARGADSSADRL